MANTIKSSLEKIIELFVSPRGNGFPILIALIGAMSIYWGYDLFMSGITQGGADLHIEMGKKGFSMGKGGPGLIFSAFGMGIIIYSIAKFSSLRSDQSKQSTKKSPRPKDIE